MKYKGLLLGLLTSAMLLLTSCNSGANSSAVESNIGIGQSPNSNISGVNPEPNASNSQTAPMTTPTATELSNTINNTLNGYGQGVQFDKNNRPLGAIQAQEKYGDLGATFIGGEDDTNIYLTFDEGYENGYTAQILDTLKEKQAKATFFVTYDYCSRNKELVKRMIDEGHSVGNHTFSHPSMPECSDSELFEEVKKLHDYVEKEFGYTMTTLRPPKGEFSERTLELTKQMGYQSVFWSFAYADWDTENQPEPAAALDKITSRTHNGAIYLLHAVSKTNTEILPDVIDFWNAKGFTVKSL